MIYIEKIDFKETDKSFIEFVESEDHIPFYDQDGFNPISVQKIEVIEGRRYTRYPDGEDIVIGLSEQAADVLGLSIDVHERMEKQISAAELDVELEREKVKEMTAVIERYSKASFIQRVRYLFTREI